MDQTEELGDDDRLLNDGMDARRLRRKPIGKEELLVVQKYFMHGGWKDYQVFHPESNGQAHSLSLALWQELEGK